MTPAPDARIGLCTGRSLALVAGALGILKAGAAYVPLDPRYPLERLHDTLLDANVRCIVADAEGIASLGAWATEHGVAIVDAAALQDIETADADALPQQTTPHPEQLAYVIYTSGSTGRPKGVGVTHANLARLFDSTAALFDFGPRRRLDAIPFARLRLLGVGAVRRAGAWWPARRRPVLDNAQTGCAAAPAARAARDGVEPDAVRVRCINAGRSRGVRTFRQRARDRVRRRTARTGGASRMASCARPGAPLRRSSTCTGLPKRPCTSRIACCATRIFTARHRALEPYRQRARRSVELHLLDADEIRLPSAAKGELYVGGAGVARGYSNRPALTAERFVPDIRSVVPGARLYRSGDIARRLPDGDWRTSAATMRR